MSPLAQKDARAALSDNGEEIQAHPKNNIVTDNGLIESNQWNMEIASPTSNQLHVEALKKADDGRSTVNDGQSNHRNHLSMLQTDEASMIDVGERFEAQDYR